MSIAVPFARRCGPFAVLRAGEQPGTDENGQPSTPAFSRLSLSLAARLKVLSLQPFIGEIGTGWLSHAIFGASAVFLRSLF